MSSNCVSSNRNSSSSPPLETGDWSLHRKSHNFFPCCFFWVLEYIRKSHKRVILSSRFGLFVESIFLSFWCQLLFRLTSFPNKKLHKKLLFKFVLTNLYHHRLLVHAGILDLPTRPSFPLPVPPPDQIPDLRIPASQVHLQGSWRYRSSGKMRFNLKFLLHFWLAKKCCFNEPDPNATSNVAH